MGCAKVSPITEEYVTTSSAIFVIDIDKRIRTIFKYSPLIGRDFPSPLPPCIYILILSLALSGRNFYEIIRQYDALQLATYHSVVCPANWSLGQDCFVNPDISDKRANVMLPKGFVPIRPWFRLTPAPDSK
jgi:alkyl hydroperoxide reductase subunit AhpC